MAAEYPGRDIGQWYRGEMTSRKLLVLVEGLSADSWFKADLRRDLQTMRTDADREALKAVRALTDGVLTGAIDTGPLEISVAEKRVRTAVDKEGR